MMGHMFGNGLYGGGWDSMPEGMQQMMQQYWGASRPFWTFSWILQSIIPILLIILLIAIIRYVWKLGDKR